MGKQINYWPGYEDFLQIAETALDCSCVIIRYAAGRELVYGRTSDIVTADWYRYFFYVPEAGALMGQQIPFESRRAVIGCTVAGNTLIEAGFSHKNDEKKEIIRSRLYVQSGFYDDKGEYVPRPVCVTKMYNRLVRMVKRLAPYTELTDTYVSMNDEDYLQEKEWKHKEYISPQFLRLKLMENYRLRL